MSKLYQLYEKEISKYDLLTTEEEVSLIYSAQNGNLKAFDKLVVSNLRFVISIAKKYSNQGLDLVDLISVGNIGLIEGIKRFDPSTGYKLITYAVWWIKQKIIEAIGSEARLIRLPLNRGAEIQEYIKKFRKQPTGTSYLYTVKNICDTYNITESELVNRVNIYYMSNPKFRDNILLSPDELIAEDFLETRLSLDTKNILKNKIELLKDRQIYIATSYFDLFGNSKTLESIGEELDLTRERVRQIKVQIIKKLSGHIEKSDFNDTMHIPYCLVKIKEDSHTEEVSILYELSDFVNENYHVVEESDIKEVDIAAEYDLNDDILMELYETL